MPRPFARNWDAQNTWVTADGRALKPNDMSDEHLLHTLKLLERKAPLLKRRADGDMLTMRGPIGEMAQVAFACEQVAQLDREDLEWLSGTRMYRLLKEEAKSRGIA